MSFLELADTESEAASQLPPKHILAPQDDQTMMIILDKLSRWWEY